MIKLAEKLKLPRLDGISRTTARSLSLTLATLSFSAFRLLRSLIRRTFSYFPPMEDSFFTSSEDAAFNDTNFLDLDLLPSSSSASPLTGSSLIVNRRRRLEDYESDDYEEERLYLVSYGWWNQAKVVTDQIGVVYNVLFGHEDSNNDDEIVFLLRKEDVLKDINVDEGVSGHECVLVSEGMWLRGLRRLQISKMGFYNTCADNFFLDVFPLKINLSLFIEETHSLLAKINSKDNAIDYFKRGRRVLGPTSDVQRIRDVSGKTLQFAVKERGVSSISEVLLDLHLYGFPVKPDTDSTCSVHMNGSAGCMNLGLTGLQNLGNTCFLNSAVQCLAHIEELVDYFLGDYRKHLNRDNPLGMKGQLALSFGELLRNLWSPNAAPVAPHSFKRKISDFSCQFSGYNQHDSQEFLAFLLDGLHEDLNRVKHKPYVEAKDADDTPDELVADEYWRNHLARNDSIIVDLFQGQYRSTLVCPDCKKKSVTFDPFMYLSLPLPSITTRIMTITIVDSDGHHMPAPVTVSVPKSGRLKDLIDALSLLISIREDEVLLLAEVYRNKVVRFLEDPNDALGLIRDADKLVAYRLPKDDSNSRLVVFMHERLEKPYDFEKLQPSRKLFGIPLLARISDGDARGGMFLRTLKPFEVVDEADESIDDVADEFEFREAEGAEGKKGSPMDVYVFWSDRMVERYDTCLLDCMAEVGKGEVVTKTASEGVSLYKCLEGFLREEPLGPDDMWYCPACHTHRQAIKKLDLWRLPDILVVHLKRFSYSRFTKNKLEAYVDFPVHHLDLSGFVAFRNERFRFSLFAVSNHYGGMGGGHYTAFVHHGGDMWYEMDDERVFPVGLDKVKSSAAYVLFYRRVS